MSAPPSQSTTEELLEPADLTSNKTEVEVLKESVIVPLPAVEAEVDETPQNSGAPASDEIVASEESQQLIRKEKRSPVSPPAERIPIHLFDEESGLKKLSYVGPVLLGGFSIILTFVVWANTKTLTERQIELQRTQTELQAEQLAAQENDMRTKFFNDLTSDDPEKKTFAAISLAGHGLKAMSVVHLALGVESGQVRESAVEVVHILFQSGSLGDRNKLLEQLKREFEYPNERLQLGVVQSLVEIEPLMNSEERGQTMQFLQERILQSRCSQALGREIVHEAVKFFGAVDPRSLPYLLLISESPRCGSGWKQAIQNLVEIAGSLPASQRVDLQKQFHAKTSEVLRKLPEQFTDVELADTSGFGIFASESNVTFVKFQEKVKEQFSRVESALSQPER